MRTRIRKIRERQGLTQAQLAAKLGVGWQTVQRAETKGTGLNLEKLGRYAIALGVPLAELLTDREEGEGPSDRAASRPFPADVPVMGSAAGAAIDDTALIIDQEAPIAWVQRPPGISLARDVYALHVVNNSMAPRYMEGELIYVSRARQARPGDHVIILISNYEGAPQQAYVKNLVRIGDDWVVAAQYNPPANVEYRRNTVAAIHRILTLKELFGL